MVHRLQRIMPGTPMPATALQWNQLIDGAQYADAERVHIASPEPPPGFWGAITRVKNESSTPRSRGEYLVAQQPLTEPAAAEDIFWEGPLLIGTDADPTSDPQQWGRAIICAEPIAPNEIGWGYPTGIALAQIEIKYPTDRFVDIDLASSNRLIAHPSGSWEIVWTDAVPDPSPVWGWAVLIHRGRWQRELRCKIPAGEFLPPGDSLNVEVWYGGNAPQNNEMITATHTWFDQNGSRLEEDTRILAKWSWEELAWLVVAADC